MNVDNPVTYRTAMADPESDKWVEAMNGEMQSMRKNQVWGLVELPPQCMTTGSKWVIKKNTGLDGNLHIFKARLVAQGFT